MSGRRKLLQESSERMLDGDYLQTVFFDTPQTSTNRAIAAINEDTIRAITDGAELIDVSSEGKRNPQDQADLSESTFSTMLLLDEEPSVSGGDQILRSLPTRMPSSTMSTSTLDDLSRLDMERCVVIAPDGTNCSEYFILSQSTSTQPSIEAEISIANATKSPENIIADLRRPTDGSYNGPYQRRLSSVPVASITELQPIEVKPQRASERISDADDTQSGDEDELSEEDDDDDILPTTKPRKISERKRRQNATAEKHLQKYLQDSIKNHKVKPQDVAQQSVKWLINQSAKEAPPIISTPRAYQSELFERAKEKNIIAVLDTGSGKTLIAVLLLRYIINQELEDRSMGKGKRVAFFLVDSVTLAFQQHAVLKTNLGQPMDIFCGEIDTGLTSRDKWVKRFNENMVIVCTAEILRQCLHYSFISMDRINLLIFDEAHHAKKDHPYARIIKDFYAQCAPGTQLPKIFGMTASPVDARVDVKKAAAQLEGLLHCEIATAEDPSLGGYKLSSQQEQSARYATLGSEYETPLCKQMLERINNPIFRKPLLFARSATRELGSWCADQVWPFCLSEDETKRLLAKTEYNYHKSMNKSNVQAPLAILEKHKAMLQEAREIVKSHEFEQPNFDPDAGSFTSTNLSSKVVLLVQYLRERYERPTEDKAIVFVRQRYTARILTRLLSHPKIATSHLRVGTLMGASSGDAGDMRVSFHEQALTMLKFRKGDINCLIATSVAEEGLDIPDCNLVIRFDLYSTLIQYIQSRGRARQANSRFIHMFEDGNQEHASLIIEVRKNERILETFCKALPADRLLSGGEYNIEYFLAREKSLPVYTVPETGAKLTYRISVSVLSRYVDSLKREEGAQEKPEYIVTVQNKKFVCEVILPESSPVGRAIGRATTTKQVAKCSAAFEACCLLLKGGQLDKHLASTELERLPAMRNAQLAVDSKKRDTLRMRTKPEIWSVKPDIWLMCCPSEGLFMTVLNLETPEILDRQSQPLALLTRSPLPQLPTFLLHFGAGKHSPVLTTPINKRFEVDRPTLGLINLFTLCIFVDVFSKGYESNPSNMPYFLVPIKCEPFTSASDPSALIDWGALNQVDEYHHKWASEPWRNRAWENAPDKFFEDKYIVDPWDGSRKLWSVGIAPHLKPLDPVPENSAPRKGTRRNNDDIMEYSCSLWAKARARRTFDEGQPVVKANLISLRRNLLDEFDATEVETPKECFIILEPLKISPLPSTVVAMAYLFPAIVHRIESYLIALDACKLVKLDISPDLALEAFTKDSDNSGEHGDEPINFQRGMGKNYERLEFLGDCFLKMATSISLFAGKPTGDEFEYHVDRMCMICNDNLRKNAVRLKLFEYIRSCSFNRRAWYPEGLVQISGKRATAPNTHKLGDKTIADICEALIGAALLNSHSTGNMDDAVRAVTTFVGNDHHKVSAYSQYYEMYKMPKYQTQPATAAQLDLAVQVERKDNYRFQYPRLLRSACVHPSYPYSYEQIPSYQRLEFLGDALLDMACINFLFHNFPEHNPQWLTEHKMAMVSNQFLGNLCVQLGFHTHLLLFHSQFQKQISDYVTEITEARDQAEKDAIRAGKTRDQCNPDYWVSVRQPPKCLPDMVEAYVGAIFVDSKFDYSQVERFFNDHIKWYFVDMSIYDSFANKHPTTFLTKFLQVNMGCMDWSIVSKEIPSVDSSKPQVMAIVMIHSQIVSDHVAESSRYAKVGAAKKAVAILQGLPLQEFRQKYDCGCSAEDEGDGGEGEGGEEHIHGTAI